MHNDDFYTFIVEYQAKLNRLLNLLQQDPKKYEIRIIETKAMIKMTEYYKEEYVKHFTHNLQETSFLHEIGDHRTRFDLS